MKLKKHSDLSIQRTETRVDTFADRTVFARRLLAAVVLVIGVVLLPSPAIGQAHPNAAAVDGLLGAPDNLSLGIDWASLFTEGGKVKDEVDATGAPGRNRVADFEDLYGGIDAGAIEDNISGGVILDMSKITGGPAIAQCVVQNGTVASAHDLGNSYMYATFNTSGDLVVYLGVERLNTGATGADTHLEIELNQDRVKVTTGEPWPVRGGRMVNDLLIRVDYSLGIVNWVEVKRWAIDGQGQGAFESVATYGGLAEAACNGDPGVCRFCNGAPPIAAPQEVWDAAGTTLDAIPPDDFLEVGVNVRALLDANFEYTAIQVRTPEDIALGNFLRIGSWSN